MIRSIVDKYTPNMMISIPSPANNHPVPVGGDVVVGGVIVAGNEEINEDSISSYESSYESSSNDDGTNDSDDDSATTTNSNHNENNKDHYVNINNDDDEECMITLLEKASVYSRDAETFFCSQNYVDSLKTYTMAIRCYEKHRNKQNSMNNNDSKASSLASIVPVLIKAANCYRKMSTVLYHLIQENTTSSANNPDTKRNANQLEEAIKILEKAEKMYLRCKQLIQTEQKHKRLLLTSSTKLSTDKNQTNAKSIADISTIQEYICIDTYIIETIQSRATLIQDSHDMASNPSNIDTNQSGCETEIKHDTVTIDKNKKVVIECFERILHILLDIYDDDYNNNSKNKHTKQQQGQDSTNELTVFQNSIRMDDMILIPMNQKQHTILLRATLGTLIDLYKKLTTTTASSTNNNDDLMLFEEGITILRKRQQEMLQSVSSDTNTNDGDTYDLTLFLTCTLRSLSELYSVRGDMDDAIDAFRDSLLIKLDLIQNNSGGGADTPIDETTIEILQRMGNASEKIYNYDKALECYEKILTAQLRYYGDSNHISVAISLVNVARVIELQKGTSTPDSVELYRAANEIFDDINNTGSNHKRILDNTNTINKDMSTRTKRIDYNNSSKNNINSKSRTILGTKQQQVKNKNVRTDSGTTRAMLQTIPMLVRRGQHEEAVRHLKRFIAIADGCGDGSNKIINTSVTLDKAQLYFDLSRAYAGMNNTEEAANCLLEVIKEIGIMLSDDALQSLHHRVDDNDNHFSNGGSKCHNITAAETAYDVNNNESCSCHIFTDEVADDPPLVNHDISMDSTRTDESDDVAGIIQHNSTKSINKTKKDRRLLLSEQTMVSVDDDNYSGDEYGPVRICSLSEKRLRSADFSPHHRPSIPSRPSLYNLPKPTKQHHELDESSSSNHTKTKGVATKMNYAYVIAKKASSLRNSLVGRKSFYLKRLNQQQQLNDIPESLSTSNTGRDLQEAKCTELDDVYDCNYSKLDDDKGMRTRDNKSKQRSQNNKVNSNFISRAFYERSLTSAQRNENQPPIVHLCTGRVAKDTYLIVDEKLSSEEIDGIIEYSFECGRSSRWLDSNKIAMPNVVFPTSEQYQHHDGRNHQWLPRI